MRTWGRVTDQYGVKYWVEVTPDPRGFTDPVHLTALCQVLKLNYGESPFYGDWGIPAHQSVVTQVQPDYYMYLTQKRFAPYFMFLGLTKRPDTFPPVPTYDITVRFQNGATENVVVIPQTMVDGFGLPVLDGYGNPLSAGTRTGRYVPQ